MDVHFTVDTEASMGGAWRDPGRRPVSADRMAFCRIGGEDYGVGAITRILSRHGFRATHFVETLVTLVNGEDDTRRVFDYLIERGQDVQLHVHPTYRFYANWLTARMNGQPAKAEELDRIGTLQESRQAALLEEADALFTRFAGYRATAFRAGCYAASRTTLRCLAKLGYRFDSSWNPCYPGDSFPGENLPVNTVSQVETLWEFPVTVARSPLPESASFKPADPCALSHTELRTMIEAAAAAGQSHFVFVFHSFSAVKSKDIGYTAIKPDRIVLRRLEKLMEYLASRPDLYTLKTFDQISPTFRPPAGVPAVPELPLIPAACRKVVQAVNRFYW